MNYGKTAYLKVLDLERRALGPNPTQNSNYIELTKQNLNLTYNSNLPQIVKFNKINVTNSQDLYIQTKTQIYSQNGGATKVSLLVDGVIILQENKYLSAGENELILFKTFTPISNQTMELSLLFEADAPLFSATIQNIFFIVLGATSTSTSESIELRAVKVPNQESVIISYIDSGNLYWTKTALTTKTLSTEDFSYYAPAISHCFCPSKMYSDTSDNVNINLYRVDLNNNLYYSTFQSSQGEQLLETEVSVVHACPCPSTSDDTNLIVYIKNNKCYFRTLKENSIVSEKSFNLPNGRYCDINAISHIDSSYVYVIATNTEGANYILRSLIEVSTGKIVEIVKADYLVALSKYIDLSFIHDKCIESLNLDAKIDLRAISYSEIMKRLCHESLNFSYSLTPTIYSTAAPVVATTYGVRLDKSITTATEWGTYTDDAQTLLPAYTDFTTGKLIDNGWLSRWPFNQIKPCFMKNGEIIGYLNPDDYSKFEDGSPALITDSLSGHVMIEIPKIYYKLTRDDNYIDVKISDQNQEGFTCAPFIHNGIENNKIYIGAYLSGPADYATSGFDSNSGKTLSNEGEPTFYNIYSTFYNTLDNNYNILTLDALTLLQTLSIILFKTTDIQRVFGAGYRSIQKVYTTGLLNTSGMYYGTEAFGTGTKLFGLEDLYSARQTMLCGAYIGDDGTFYYADNSISTDYSPNGFASFIKSDITFPLLTSLKVGDDIVGSNLTGFLFNKGTGTSNTKNFCDAYSIIAGKVFFMGMPSTGYFNGIFSMKNYDYYYENINQAIRIMYYPNK